MLFVDPLLLAASMHPDDIRNELSLARTLSINPAWNRSAMPLADSASLPMLFGSRIRTWAFVTGPWVPSKVHALFEYHALCRSRCSAGPGILPRTETLSRWGNGEKPSNKRAVSIYRPREQTNHFYHNYIVDLYIRSRLEPGYFIRGLRISNGSKCYPWQTMLLKQSTRVAWGQGTTPARAVLREAHSAWAKSVHVSECFRQPFS